MSGVRITRQTSAVLSALVGVHDGVVLPYNSGGNTVNTHVIYTKTHLSSATINRVLERLERADWVTWELADLGPNPGYPPPRLYRLTEEGLAAARDIVASMAGGDGNG